MAQDRGTPEPDDRTLPSGAGAHDRTSPSGAAGEDRTVPSGAGGHGDPDATIASRPGGPAEAPGDALLSVPGFRILGKLGEGGMGLVYEAEQQSPRRRVALKVVRGGPIADELHVRLFRREADMLARLEHPNIAAIYESGRTEGGHHWFAMELVRGEPLDEWLTTRRSGGTRSAYELHERLEIFRAICDAVQYAHQRGVIHRDLKPSNLIVLPDSDSSATGAGTRTAADARPRVKVLDFGLARLTDPDSEGASLASTAGTIRGTLNYMSPEQVRGEVDKLDVRTDVYSLGVVLYELLADARPYQVPGQILEAIRTIETAVPPPLATNWPGPGRPDVDLDTIVRKALAKEPGGRYAGAGDLGEDTRRWLASEPILARPPSTLYQVRKLVARHRLPVAAAGVVLLLILTSAVGMSFLYVASERNLDRALVAEEAARDEAATAKNTTEFVVGLFAESRPEQALGEEVTAREILDRGAERVRRELRDEPLVRARLTSTIGDVYQRMGLYGKSRPLFEESLDTRIARLGENAPEVAVTRNLLAQALQGLGELDSARVEFDRSLAIFESRRDTTNADYARILSNYGWLEGQTDRTDRGLDMLERAVAILEALPDAEFQDLSGSLNNLATVRMNRNEFQAAREALDQAREILRANVPDVHPSVADVITNLGVLEGRQENPAKALEAFQEVLRIREIVEEPDSPELLQALGNVAMTYAELGRLDEALPLLQRAAVSSERVHGPGHPDAAQARYNLGLARLETGDLPGARADLEAALGVYRVKYGEESLKVSMALYFLAEVHRGSGELPQSRALFERVVEIDSKVLGPDNPEVASDLETLIEVLQELGDEGAVAVAESRREAILAAQDPPAAEPE